MKDVKKVNAIDILRLFFAYCVVAIHTNAISSLEQWQLGKSIVSSILGFAVPYFFICSGYFFARKISRENADDIYIYIYIKQYAKRLAVPYLFWGSIYFLISTALDIVIRDMSVKQGLLSHVHQWIVSSPGGGLWYIQAILIMLVPLVFCIKKKYGFGVLVGVLFVTSSFISVLPVAAQQNAVFSSTYKFYIDIFLDNTNVFSGGIFFLVGMACVKIEQINFKNSLLFHAFFAFLGLLVCIVFETIGQTSVILKLILHIVKIISSVEIFLAAKNLLVPISARASLRCRKMSAIIYFMHFLVIYTYKVIFTFLGVGIADNGGVLFILSAVLLTVIAIVVERMLDSKKWLSKLY